MRRGSGYFGGFFLRKIASKQKASNGVMPAIMQLSGFARGFCVGMLQKSNTNIDFSLFFFPAPTSSTAAALPATPLPPTGTSSQNSSSSNNNNNNSNRRPSLPPSPLGALRCPARRRLLPRSLLPKRPLRWLRLLLLMTRIPGRCSTPGWGS